MMKKFKLFSLALAAVLFVGVYSCNSGTKTEAKDAVEETVVTEEAVEAETEVADSVQAEEPAAEEVEGMEAE
jgi:hypothetical protein